MRRPGVKATTERQLLDKKEVRMAKVVAPRGERGQSPEFDPSNRSVLVLLLQGKFVLVLLI